MGKISLFNMAILILMNVFAFPEHSNPIDNWLNTSRPRQNGCGFTDDTFKCIFLNENVRISIKNLLKFIPKGPIDNIPSLVQTMAWRRPGDKPLSEPMMVRLPMHICIVRPQWVKWISKDLWSIENYLILSNDLYQTFNQILKQVYHLYHAEQ